MEPETAYPLVLRTRQEHLSGWGHDQAIACPVYRPEEVRECRPVVAHLPHADATAIARGSGRAYGDAAMNDSGVVSLARCDRLLEWDASQGIIRAEAGVTLGELMDVFVPRGWLVPVLPGTRYVSLGGAIAANVHGKNHWRDGDIARHITSLELQLPGGEIVECSSTQYADLFWATAGGMGMTGIILSVSLKLRPIQTLAMKTRTMRVPDLSSMCQAFREHASRADYMVGWIDHTGVDQHLGRGVFEAASHMEQCGETDMALSYYHPPTVRFSVPRWMPGWVLNRHSMACYNKYRFGRYTEESLETVTGLQHFFHPLDSIQHWYRLYGRKGFYQFQCLFPDGDKQESHMADMLQVIQQEGFLSYLAVIKYHGAREGMMSFPDAGFSLALDFPATNAARGLINQLHDRVSAFGGRVYLAKDALLTTDQFAKIYSDSLPRWRAVLQQVDPDRLMHSQMAQRLQFRDVS